MGRREANRLRVVDSPPSWPSEARNNLPLRLTSFVGRQDELLRVQELLRSNRLLTLTGAAGAGKSRLAIRLAEMTLADFPAGAWLVQLADVDGAHLIAPTIATEIAALPELTGSDLVEHLSRLLAGRPLLLLLDNCEHLVEGCADVANRLLGAVPGLKIVATSREPLGVPGEIIHTVPPLSLPAEATIGGLKGEKSDAVILFVDRLRGHRPDIVLAGRDIGLVNEIVRQLDGLPLAIELAAAHTRYLSLSDLVIHLAGGSLRGPPTGAVAGRHRSLSYALDSSFNMLTEPQRELFIHLSVCVGGFDLDAVAAIGGISSPHRQQGELVWGLVDRSLLTVTEGARGRSRYRMLEPIRQYAMKSLVTAGGLDATREWHARHYAAVVDTAAGELFGSDQAAWLDRLEQEIGNLRLSLEWSCSHDVQMACQLATRLRFFWTLRWHVAEGRRWLERIVAQGATDAAQSGWALAALACMIVAGPSPREGLAAAGKALEISTTSGDAALRVRALLALGHAVMRDDRARTADLFANAVEAARQVGDRALIAETLSEEATSRLMLGDRDSATALAREALAIARDLGNRHLISSSAMVLARDAAYQGLPEAAAIWTESLASSRELGDAERIRFCAGWLAVLAASEGDLEAAIAGLAEELRVSRAMGAEHGKLQVLDDAAIVALHADRPVPALRLAAAASSGKGTSWVESPFWASRMVTTVREARARLPLSAADTAWSDGSSMSIDTALTEAEGMLDDLARRRRSRRPQAGVLSRREIEVAHLIARGLTNRELSSRLFISERTSEGHVQHILNKLGFDNRTQIAVWMAEDGRTVTGPQHS